MQRAFGGSKKHSFDDKTWVENSKTGGTEPLLGQKRRKGQKSRETALFAANPRFFGKKTWKGGSGWMPLRMPLLHSGTPRKQKDSSSDAASSADLIQKRPDVHKIVLPIKLRSPPPPEKVSVWRIFY